MMYLDNALRTDYRTRLQFVETPEHIARATAEAALDLLYADVLPQAPVVRLADAARIARMAGRDAYAS